MTHFLILIALALFIVAIVMFVQDNNINVSVFSVLAFIVGLILYVIASDRRTREEVESLKNSPFYVNPLMELTNDHAKFAREIDSLNIRIDNISADIHELKTRLFPEPPDPFP